MNTKDLEMSAEMNAELRIMAPREYRYCPRREMLWSDGASHTWDAAYKLWKFQAWQTKAEFLADSKGHCRRVA